MLLLVVGTVLYAAVLGVLGLLFLGSPPEVAFNAARVLPALNGMLLLLILGRAWIAALDRERARRHGEALLGIVRDTLQASIRIPPETQRLS